MTASPGLAIHRAKKTGTFLLLSLTLLLSGAALASGGGSFGGGSTSSSTSNSASKLDSKRYALGKQVYKSSVNCSGCLINQARLSKIEATRLYKQVKKDDNLKSSLSKKERKALKYYMQKRFKL